MEELMRMEHISKRFGNFYANKDVNLTVRRGEVLTLLGENGAGKSTLMNILIGLYQPTEGKIFLHGKEARIESPGQAVKLGIGMVHQHFMLVQPFTVTENIVLGTEPTKGVKLDMATARRNVVEISERYGLSIDPDARIEDISVGMQQRVEILKALYRGADILILDEPTSSLTPQEIVELIEIMHTNPANRFNIGHGLFDGAGADFTVFDLEKCYIVDGDEFLTKGRATPFIGKELYGRCKGSL